MRRLSGIVLVNVLADSGQKDQKNRFDKPTAKDITKQEQQKIKGPTSGTQKGLTTIPRTVGLY
jgi:hypothetical protein